MIQAPPGAAAVALVPAYELSDTALQLSRVIEREANRRSALRGSGVVRVEQNFPLFRRMSSGMHNSFRHTSRRSRGSVTQSIAPMPEDRAISPSSPPVTSLPPLRSASPSLVAPSPRISMVRGAESMADTGEQSQATSDSGSDEPLTLRGRIWQFFDDPNSSVGAYYFSVSLFFFIALSTMVFIAQTDKSLARHRNTLNTMETICAMVFTIEYLLRALVAPSKWQFAKNFGNWVDLAAILPYYLEAILAVENAGSFGAIRIVRLTRVARVLKMSRYSSAIQVFVQAIAISIKALSMLVFLMAIAVVVFSSAIYFAEYTPDGCRDGGWVGQCDGVNASDWVYAESFGAASAAAVTSACTCVDPNPYSSIAESFWWSIVTMSTVGYGDMTPVTTPGRIVGIATILTGMLVLALPITVIGTNFQKVMKSVMQQTMKSNVDYLKGKRQICREEIEAILQRFHAVTTDIHLNIDDIIQVYDTDDSGTLEDDELARFRRDLDMLQNRALLNQNLDLQTPPTAVAIATPLGATDGCSSPVKTVGAIMRKLSSRGDIFRPSFVQPTRTSFIQAIPPPQTPEPSTVEKLRSVARPVIRTSLSQPSRIGSTVDRAIEEPKRPRPHPVVRPHPAVEAVSHHREPGPSPDQVVPLSPSMKELEGESSSLHSSPSGSPTHSSPAHSHHHYNRPNHHHHHHSEGDVVDRLVEIQRALEDRMVQTEARLESKILNLTKILMRVEKLIEFND